MPDGRSLCDRRAYPRSLDIEHCSDEEFETYISELTESPACGPCILLAGYLRSQAIVALERNEGRAHPPTVREGWEQLRGTRWATEIDLDDFLSRDFSRDKYDSLMFQADPARIGEGVEIGKKRVENMRQRRRNRK